MNRSKKIKRTTDVSLHSSEDIDHENALFNSINRREFDVFVCLLVKSPPINPLSLVYHACISGCPEYIAYLLETGLVSKKEISDFSYIHVACSFGHISVIKLLVDSGANVRYDNDSLLVLASSNGYVDLVKYLIEKGCTPSSADSTALFFACQDGDLRIVRLLVENGADIYAKGGVLPKCCDVLKCYDIVDYFIQQGVPRDMFSDNALRYVKMLETKRIEAANKIRNWWGPLLRRINPEFIMKEAEESWNRVEKMYAERSF